MKKTKKIALALIITLSTIGTVAHSSNSTTEPTPNKASEQKHSSEVLEGRVLGISKKAHIITLRKEDSVEMIKFNKETSGLEFAGKNENILVRCEIIDGERHAIAVTPKFAVLPKGVLEIEADALVEIVEEGPQNDYLIIDARPTSQYQAGHIPSAISIPLMNLQDNHAMLASDAGDKTLIFYSDGLTCGLCTDAADIATKQGHKKVKVLLAGTKGWEEEGELLAVSDELIKNGNVVLIDTRDSSEVNSGYIANAVNISQEKFEDEELAYEFPTQRSAPIVFYGHDTNIAQAEKTISKWGYHKLRQVDGGYEGWKSRGGAISVGSAPGTEGITWNNEISDRQISKQDFKKIMKSLSADTIILDVRTAKEAKRGRIKNSINIPLEDLSSRLTEIPSDKKIITHCATGSRAEMAALFLDSYATDVHYLSAKVRCKGEKCRVK